MCRNTLKINVKRLYKVYTTYRAFTAVPVSKNCTSAGFGELVSKKNVGAWDRTCLSDSSGYHWINQTCRRPCSRTVDMNSCLVIDSGPPPISLAELTGLRGGGEKVGVQMTQSTSDSERNGVTKDDSGLWSSGGSQECASNSGASLLDECPSSDGHSSGSSGDTGKGATKEEENKRDLCPDPTTASGTESHSDSIAECFLRPELTNMENAVSNDGCFESDSAVRHNLVASTQSIENIPTSENARHRVLSVTVQDQLQAPTTVLEGCESNDPDRKEKKSVLPANLLESVTAAISLNPELAQGNVNDISESGTESELGFLASFCGLLDEEKPVVHKPSRKRKRKDAFSDDKWGGVEGKERASKKPRPNYFLAVQITNPQIHTALGVVQQHILKQEEELKPAVIPLPTLHLTLMVMHLATSEDISRARDALNACESRLESLTRELVLLVAEGVDNFRNQVVFAKLNQNAGAENLRKISDVVCKVFKEHGVSAGDDKGFKPHVTLLKLSKLSKKHKRKGIKKVPPDLYQRYANCTFGAQTVRSVQLCSMLKRKDEFGYYYVEHKLDLVPGDMKEVDIEFCHIDSETEQHVCLPKPTPGKRFRDQFQTELKWTFKKSGNL